MVLLAACGGAATTGGKLVTLRPICPAGQFWDAHRVQAARRRRREDRRRQESTRRLQVRRSQGRARCRGAHGGPLDHEANVTLWEQQGIRHAYVDEPADARTAFDMMLALDPGHLLSYKMSAKATDVFQEVREAKSRIVPSLDVNWPRGQRVGDPVPLDVGVIADPKEFLRRATLFVRARGEHAWRAADVALRPPGSDTRIVLPPVTGTKPTSLEVYLRAYDAGGNEVLAWADPDRPREIPLRYDPPTPWYRKWWVIAIAGSVVAAGTGVTVYELTLASPTRSTRLRPSARSSEVSTS